MTKPEWTFVELSEGARQRAHLGAEPWPVRAGTAAEVARGQIDPLELVEDADRYCEAHPDAVPALAANIARLAWMVAVDALDDHLWPQAIHACSIGLRYEPRNVSLWSHLALARYGAGEQDAALAAFAQAISSARQVAFFAPMLWILAARAYDDAGQPAVARGLLEDVASFLPGNDEFWSLLAAVRARAEAEAA